MSTTTRRRRRGGRGRSHAATAGEAADPLDVPFPEAEPAAPPPPQTVALPSSVPIPPPASAAASAAYNAAFSAGYDSYNPPPPSAPSFADEQKLALFIDIDNLFIGLRESGHPRFDVKLLLSRLLEKGKIVIKRAYADWNRYSEYKRAFHEAAFELIDIPQHRISGKNSADIRMVVDAMDLASNKEHLTTFVIGSGDSDFSPLVSKLKENNKQVLGFGVKGSTSDLLIENCDEFLYYEDLVRERPNVPVLAGMNEKLVEAFTLLIDSILALKRENKEVLWGSLVKQTMQRKNPSFNESYYGFRAFSELLEAAEKQKLITLKKDGKSGSYVVTGFGPGGV